MVRVHGVDLHVEDSGGSGETVLFLHGFLFDGRQYQAQIGALRETFRCVTVDFRGQGRSGPARGGYQVEQHAADVLAVIRRLGLAPVHLVGLSMGGFVAMRLAAREPAAAVADPAQHERGAARAVQGPQAVGVGRGVPRRGAVAALRAERDRGGDVRGGVPHRPGPRGRAGGVAAAVVGPPTGPAWSAPCSAS